MGYERCGGWHQTEREFREASVRELERGYHGAMGEFLAGLREWNGFATLTFDPESYAVDRWGLQSPAQKVTARASETGRLAPQVSEASARRRFQHFADEAEARLERSCEVVVALEHHKSGQPHGHALLAIQDGLIRGDVVTLSRFWRGFGGNGYLRIEEPNNRAAVATYCAKYMAKELGDIIFSEPLGRRLL